MNGMPVMEETHEAIHAGTREWAWISCQPSLRTHDDIVLAQK